MNSKEPESADEHGLSELGSSLNTVQVEQKSYVMPPRDGFTVEHFLTVADINRSADFYEKVFGGRVLSRGETLSVPNPDKINSFMNIRVADIQACYELWKSRGAEFITEPIPKYGEIRCYIRDPDGYIIEVGQSTDLTYG